MKPNKIKSIASALLMGVALMGCHDPKELIIIEGNLPIKTSALYMVGDATPNGWSIDNPTPLTAEGEDPLVFSWEGNLYAGEMKLCLSTGSWDVAFIRPEANGTEIGHDGIENATFAMSAGDPDNKWRVTEAGLYHLTFDLRNWTMSTAYLGGQELPPAEPIEAEALYIVGDATPGGWNIDGPTECVKQSQYIFVFEGELKPGEMKACTATGSWDVAFVRPASDGCKIGKDGVENDGFVYTTGPDNKWRVADHGEYRLTFDLEHLTIKAEYLKEIVNEKNPIETGTLFMIGDATPGGWSMDDASEFTVDPSDKYIFTWEGDLVEGSMKACTERDGTFSCPFLRPESAGVEISPDGVAAPGFVYTTGPDDQWRVTKAGRYRITFNLRDWTIEAKAAGDAPDTPDTPDTPAVNPIEAKMVLMIGDATPNGWSMDDATELTVDPSNSYLFTWEGELKTGEMKACTERDGTFSCPFLRPTFNGCKISRSGVEAPEVVYTTDPDDKWQVTEAGRYRIAFDLAKRTIAVTPLD